MQKPSFMSRFLAYFIDMVIVAVVVGLIGNFLPNRDNVAKLNEEYNSITQSYIDSEISYKSYMNQISLVSYDLDYANVLYYIVEVFFVILYYVVFQFYNGGQTIGKKVFKIRVVGNNGYKLTLNDYIFRSMILNSVFVNIIVIGSILFLSRNYYFNVGYALQIIQYVLLLVTIIMVMFKKDGRGLHDIVAKSKVVKE